ncbi:hypothetical protein CQA56_12790 [Escherichia coli]|nr:hypothetical protein CA270_07055 [Escherichia coli]AXY45199.1 hypothetical protein CIW80_04655 [Escherichia coli Nissle 1917]ESD52860.1 hypothetical protein HMPREF1607_04393 [Escherichia coli 908524]ARX26850.1 hypothetical protein AM437_22145 [Escherichia coli]ASA42162.1 hypothetical protein CCL28_08620 [Escherichia coli]
MMTNAKLPDALCLSDLHEPCNILNFCAFVGRIRRLRHIQHEQSAHCQQSEGRNISALFLACHIVCYTSQLSLLLLHK